MLFCFLTKLKSWVVLFDWQYVPLLLVLSTFMSSGGGGYSTFWPVSDLGIVSAPSLVRVSQYSRCLCRNNSDLHGEQKWRNQICVTVLAFEKLSSGQESVPSQLRTRKNYFLLSLLFEKSEYKMFISTFSYYSALVGLCVDLTAKIQLAAITFVGREEIWCFCHIVCKKETLVLLSNCNFYHSFGRLLILYSTYLGVQTAAGWNK